MPNVKQLFFFFANRAKKKSKLSAGRTFSIYKKDFTKCDRNKKNFIHEGKTGMAGLPCESQAFLPWNRRRRKNKLSTFDFRVEVLANVNFNYVVFCWFQDKKKSVN